MRKESLTGRLLRWAGLCALYLLTRAMVFLPWVWNGFPRNAELTLAVRCLAALLILVLAVLPEHGFHCWYVMRMNGDDSAPYSYARAIRVGLCRLTRVSWAFLPAAAVPVLIGYIMDNSFKMLGVFRDIGDIFAGSRQYNYDVGLSVLLVAGLVFLVLFLVFWYRGTPNDYLRSVTPFRKARFDRLALRNFALAVLPYLLWGLILALFMTPLIASYRSLLEKVGNLGDVIREVLGQHRFVLEMAFVLVLVYCPLWCVRKRGAAKEAAAMKSHEA